MIYNDVLLLCLIQGVRMIGNQAGDELILEGPAVLFAIVLYASVAANYSQPLLLDQGLLYCHDLSFACSNRRKCEEK
jgi:hypothetical protein